MPKVYKALSIQTFTHESIDLFACRHIRLGSTEKQKAVAMEEFAVLSHRVRAASHAYFWLMAFKDAISEVLTKAPTTSVYDYIDEISARLAAASSRFIKA